VAEIKRTSTFLDRDAPLAISPDSSATISPVAGSAHFRFDQEKMCPIGRFETADAIRSRVGEGAFHMMKSSLSNSPSGSALVFTSTSACEALGRKSMERLRHHLLAAAVLVGLRRADAAIVSNTVRIDAARR
jgi:hypothetical protein